MLPNCKEKFSQIQDMTSQLHNNIYQSNLLALSALEKNDFSILEEAKKLLKNSDNLGNDIDNAIIKAFALFGPEAIQLRQLVSFLKIVSELVRISDYLKKYIKALKSVNAVENIQDYLIQIHKSNDKIFDILNEAIKKIDTEDFDFEQKYSIILAENSKIEDFNDIVEKEILEKFSDISYIELFKLIRRLEKCSDRAVTISRLLLFTKDGGKIKNY